MDNVNVTDPNIVRKGLILLEDSMKSVKINEDVSRKRKHSFGSRTPSKTPVVVTECRDKKSIQPREKIVVFTCKPVPGPANGKSGETEATEEKARWPTKPKVDLDHSFAKDTALWFSQVGVKSITPNSYVDPKYLNEQQLLIKAYTFYYGWGEEKDYDIAFKTFQKVASGKICQAEGAFRVAEMLYYGKGRDPDIPQAISLFQKTALLPENNPAEEFNSRRNVGVGESRYFLGRHYEEKADLQNQNKIVFYTPFNLQIASMWYTMGHVSHHYSSSFQLASMYIRGKGVPRNDYIAESYLKDATSRQQHNAYVHLVKLYIDRQDYHIAFAVIDSCLSMTKKDEKFYEKMKKLLAEVIPKLRETSDLKAKVKEFEGMYDLIKKGFTFRERLARMDNVSKYASGMARIVTDTRDVYVTTKVNTKPEELTFKSLEQEDYDNLCWRSAITEDNSYIHELVETLAIYHRVVTLINRYAKDASCLTRDHKKEEEFVFLVAELLQLDPFAIKWENNYLQTIYSLLKEIRENNKNESGNEPVFCQSLAICLGEIGAKCDPNGTGFKFLVRAWTLYPEQVQLSITLAKYYAAKKDFDRAYMAGAEALERYPEHVNLLFNQAQICLQACSGVIATPGEMKRKALMYFEKFLSKASDDHPQIPEVYYLMGKVFYDMHKDDSHKHPKLFVTTVKYFIQLGEDAERNQLVCFIPYRSMTKEYLSQIVDPPRKIEEAKHLENFYTVMLRNVTKTCDAVDKPDDLTAALQTEMAQPKPRVQDDEHKVVKVVSHDTNRVRLIVNLRNHLSGSVKKQTVNMCSTSTPEDGTLLSETKNPATPLFSMHVNEILLSDAKRWENRHVHLKIVDEVLFTLREIQMVAEDTTTKDVIRVVIQSFPENWRSKEKFGFGCELKILSPKSVNINGEIVVKVEDQDTIIFYSRDNTLCRFCMKPGAKMQCSQCKWANYCDKDCQSNDWKILKHKKICNPSPSWTLDRRGSS